jgi:hypothetical protein
MRKPVKERSLKSLMWSYHHIGLRFNVVWCGLLLLLLVLLLLF